MKSFKAFYDTGAIQSIVDMNGRTLVVARCFDLDGSEIFDFKTSSTLRDPKYLDDESYWVEIQMDYNGSTFDWQSVMSFVYKPKLQTLEMTFDRIQKRDRGMVNLLDPENVSRADLGNVLNDMNDTLVSASQSMESVERIILEQVSIPVEYLGNAGKLLPIE